MVKRTRSEFEIPYELVTKSEFDILNFTKYDKNDIMSICTSFIDTYFGKVLVYDNNIISNIPYLTKIYSIDNVRNYINTLI